MTYKYDVFISYSRKDTIIADEIITAFEKEGITFFIDRRGIMGGMEFPAVLAQAIRESKVFLFLASENSYASKFTQKEIVYAFNKKESQDIIPYIIDGSKLPEELEFTFSDINWRVKEKHPINTVLIDDVLYRLGRERSQPPVEKEQPPVEKKYTFPKNQRTLLPIGKKLWLRTKRFPKWLIATLVLLPLVLFGVRYGIMSHNTHNMEKKMLTEDMIKQAEKSVVQIKTDSVYLMAYNKTTGDTLLIDSCEYMVSGTAFITDDSLLVTARHCVEPWLNVDSIPADSSKIESLPVKWALMAETRNQEEGDSIEWMVVSRLSVVIYDSTGSFIIEKFSSTDFNIEKSRDHVIEYGDFDHLYFWRSIAALPRRTDMMLDDFAFLRLPAHLASHAEGAIHLASKEEILQLEKRQPITILGFPESGVGASDFELSTDELWHLPAQDSLGFPDGVLHHNGEIARGFSGGPVLVRNGNECYAVGIISVHNRLNKNRTLSVPVSEVERWKMKQNNNK